MVLRSSRSHISAKAPGAALLKCEYLYNGSLSSPAGYPGSPLDHVAAFLNKRDLSLVKGLPDSSVGKESACHAGDTEDAGSIPGWEDPLEEGMATYFSILAWRIPWTEDLVRLSP